MKDIFVVDSYAHSPEQADMLASMIGFLAKINRDICLVSHLPIPEHVVNPNVKFVIYDSNNVLGPTPMTLTFKTQDLEVRCQPKNFYHGPAVYSSLHNALRLLAHRYDWIHFVESDVDVSAIQQHLDGGFARLKDRHDVKVIGYPFVPDDPVHRSAAILTALISLRPEIGDSLPVVTSWDEYQRFRREKTMVLEAWLLDLFKTRNIKYELLDDLRVAEKSHIGGDYVVVKCRQYNSLFMVFIINQSPSAIDVKWTFGATRRVEAGETLYSSNMADSDEILVSFVGSETVHHHPLKTMLLGAFRKQGANLCPDWFF
jgi:hypothetical protein